MQLCTSMGGDPKFYTRRVDANTLWDGDLEQWPQNKDWVANTLAGVTLWAEAPTY